MNDHELYDAFLAGESFTQVAARAGISVELVETRFRAYACGMERALRSDALVTRVSELEEAISVCEERLP